jgi:hypothetical protein
MRDPPSIGAFRLIVEKGVTDSFNRVRISCIVVLLTLARRAERLCGKIFNARARSYSVTNHMSGGLMLQVARASLSHHG